MWFILGIVSFSGFFVYRLWRKIYWAWGWSDDKGYLRLRDRLYKVRHSQHKGVQRFAYAVACPPGLYFRIKRETRWDDWAKRIGLSVERQFSDPDFDKDLYFVSDDPAWLSELSHVAELRTVVKTLFHDKNLRNVTCEGCHLWVEVQLQATDIPLTYLNGAAAHNIVAALHSIADSLGTITKQHDTNRRDPYAFRAIVLVSLSSALLMLAGLELFRIALLERGTVILDSIALFGFSSIIAAVALFLFMLIGAAWLRGSSYAHVVMLEILLSGGLGLSGSSYALLRDVNCNWDNVISTPHVVTVTKKQTGSRRRYGTYYTLYFDAPFPADIPRSMEVNRTVYSQAVTGEHMLILVKPGYLGYRWVEAIQHPKTAINSIPQY